MHGPNHHDDRSLDIATTYVLDDYAAEHGRSVHVYDGEPDDVEQSPELRGDKRGRALAAIRSAIDAELGAAGGDVQHVKPELGRGDLDRLRTALSADHLRGPVTWLKLYEVVVAALDGS